MIDYLTLKQKDSVTINGKMAKRIMKDVTNAMDEYVSLTFVREDGTIWYIDPYKNEMEFKQRKPSNVGTNNDHPFLVLPVEKTEEGKYVYKGVYVAKLVAEYFMPEYPWPECKYKRYRLGRKDGDNMNCRLDNLYWRDEAEIEQIYLKRGEQMTRGRQYVASVKQQAS